MRTKTGFPGRWSFFIQATAAASKAGQGNWDDGWTRGENLFFPACVQLYSCSGIFGGIFTLPTMTFSSSLCFCFSSVDIPRARNGSIFPSSTTSLRFRLGSPRVRLLWFDKQPLSAMSMSTDGQTGRNGKPLRTPRSRRGGLDDPRGSTPLHYHQAAFPFRRQPSNSANTDRLETDSLQQQPIPTPSNFLLAKEEPGSVRHRIRRRQGKLVPWIGDGTGPAVACTREGE